MPLPKITHPTFEVTIPSSNKKTRIRPMLVKEEKLLLMAKESKEDSDILEAVKQVVTNCLIDESVDPSKFTFFDLEYVFLKIRSFSVGNEIQVSYRDGEDNEVRSFKVDLNEVSIDYPDDYIPGKPKVLNVSDTISITLKYPTAELYSEKMFDNLNNDEIFDKMISGCIDKVYEGDQAFPIETATHEELKEFLESLDVNTYDELRKFLSNAPKLSYVITYKNNMNNDRKIELSTLTDFFILR